VVISIAIGAHSPLWLELIQNPVFQYLILGNTKVHFYEIHQILALRINSADISLDVKDHMG
jgi:hypothetical protein